MRKNEGKATHHALVAHLKLDHIDLLDAFLIIVAGPTLGIIMTIAILIVDGHPVFGVGLRALIGAQGKGVWRHFNDNNDLPNAISW